MKIANVVCAWPPYAGGIAGSAQQIEQILQKQHTVTTFSPQHLKPWLRYGHGAWLPQLLWRLWAYDYIYLHYPFFGGAEMVWLFKLLFRRPKLIIHYHMDTTNLVGATKILSWPSRLILSSLLNQAEVVVSASFDYLKNSQIAFYYKKHPEKFREIPFGINLEKFQVKASERPTENRLIKYAQEIITYVNDRLIKKNKKKLLFVGGLDQAHYFKGVEILIRALKQVKNSNWQLEIVGSGDQRSTYENLVASLNLTSKITFSGKLEEVYLIKAYQNADLFILPSINRHEAFGIVLIEALACGVPVIASDLPGVRSVFNKQQEGLLVKPGDLNDLSAKIDWILSNETRRHQMAINARRLALKKYDERLMAEKIISLFL